MELTKEQKKLQEAISEANEQQLEKKANDILKALKAENPMLNEGKVRVEIKSVIEEQQKDLKEEYERIKSKFDELSEEYDSLREMKKTFAHNPKMQKDIVLLHEIANKAINDKVEGLGGVDRFMDLVKSCATSKNAENLVFTLKGLHEITAGPTTPTNILGANTPEEATQAMYLYLTSDEQREIRYRQADIFRYITVRQGGKAVSSFTEWAPLTDDFLEILEGEEKPEIEITAVSTLYGRHKLPARMQATEEVWMDFDELTRYVNNTLFTKYRLDLQKVILTADNGDPTSPENGILTIAPAFDPATIPPGFVGQDPNMFDVIIAMTNQVATAVNYDLEENIMATTAMIPITNWHYDMLQKKDSNNNYMFILGADNIIRTTTGLEIVLVQDNVIPNGSILVGDLSLFVLKLIGDLSIRFGMYNEQFINNELTVILEQFHQRYIKTLDRRGFCYDTISNVIAALSIGNPIT